MPYADPEKRRQAIRASKLKHKAKYAEYNRRYYQEVGRAREQAKRAQRRLEREQGSDKPSTSAVIPRTPRTPRIPSPPRTPRTLRTPEEKKLKKAESNRRYRERHREEYKEKKRQYYQRNKPAIHERARQRRHRHPQAKLAHTIRVRMGRVCKGRWVSRSAVAALGISIDGLKAHLESLFQPGMTWENHGRDGWHIDHIVPLIAFDLTDLEQFAKACHYTNLQPLWAKDNLRKNRYQRSSTANASHTTS